MKKLFLILLLLPFAGTAQEKGIYFEHGLSWQQVKEKAKRENKYLFVDCYTTWCAPCKKMATEIFTQEQVGDFFNTNFINVKVQFDQTKDDSGEVKSWYADAKAINSEFKITAYPTFLIFSPKGELVHRIVGGGTADDFIARAKIGLDPKAQYYTLIKKYESGLASPQQLRQLALAANGAGDQENATKFADAYLATQKELYTKDNMEFLSRFVQKSNSKGFELMLNNMTKVDSILGPGKANEILSSVIVRESINPVFSNTHSDVDSLVSAVQAKYPAVDISKSTDMVKILFFQLTKKWDRFQPAILSYMNKYGSELIPSALNYFSRIVLENCNEKASIAAAMTWSKSSVEKTQRKEPVYLDTYAQLLYQLGEKEEAIAMEQTAVRLVSGDSKAKYAAILDWMMKGK
ncbi:thioredoxin family protein [Pedobacter sp. GR22-6]|uniref:thioredoxin family protein n=1 Tax=Pedobacter sp. GR22-6 TaxID=3127957 RepID=UPI00307F19EF